MAPWGLRGEIKVEVLSDYPQRFVPKARVLVKGVPLEIERSRAGAAALVLKLASIDSREQAEGLRDQLLEVPASELMPLQPGEYFVHQVLGLQVVTTEGRDLGQVTEVLRTGSNDVYLVRQGSQEFLIPAIADVVQQIDLDARQMVIEVVPGLLE